MLLARIAAARDRAGEARAHLRDALAADPRDPEAHRELVRLEIAQGDLAAAAGAAQGFGRAAEEADRANGGEPDGGAGWTAQRLREQAAEAWLLVARAMADRQDDAGAEEAFSRAAALDPGTDESLLARAAFLESRRRWAEARELELKLLARRPDSPDLLAALARTSLAEGDLEVASAHAHKLLGLATAAGPDSPDEERRDLAGALFRIAVPLLGAHRSQDALAALDGALRLFPRHPELAFYRGLALSQRGRNREAVQVFDQIERALGEGPAPAAAQAPAFLAPDPAQLLLDVRVQAALTRARAGEPAEGARRLRALFAEHPEDEGVSLGLIEGLERAGRSAEAVPLIEASVQRHAGNPALLFALGTALDRAGRVDDALSAMRKVLAAAPAHAGALNYVGYTMAEQGGDLGEAEGLLRRAEELRPEDGAIADSLGYCLLKRGRVEPALAELRRADRLAPGDPVILGHLGDALLAAGRKDEAADAFRRGLSRLGPAPRRTRGRRAQAKAEDGEPRAPEPGDARVRAELIEKLRALTAR